MDYCKDALRLLHKKIIGCDTCPIMSECPRLILEDATDEAVDKAIEAMVKVLYRKYPAWKMKEDKK